MFRKTLFLLILAFVGYGKLSAQNYNPPIHVPDLPCNLTICLVAWNGCNQKFCGQAQCVTVYAHNPGVYYANPITNCLANIPSYCVNWAISFSSGPCENIPSDAPTKFRVNQFIPTSWTEIGTGQGYSFMWDGTDIYVQP